MPSRTPIEFGLVSRTLQWIYDIALWTSFHDVIYLLPHENNEPSVEKLKDQFELDRSAVARDTAEPDRSGACR